ncbi:MAG: hypothetical protein NVV68_10850 [Dokdonella sp.]|nr:hypothetical protein [Dokdonella sp.]
MPSPPPVRIVLFALAAFALYRVLGLLLHDPLLALANNYDQIRYTGCYDVGPLRADVPAWHSNPQAPLRIYARQAIPEGNCYWSTDWLAGAAVARPGASPSRSATRPSIRSVPWACCACPAGCWSPAGSRCGCAAPGAAIWRSCIWPCWR